MRLLVVVVALASCWKPFSPPRPAQRDVQPELRVIRLENGLRVVAIHDATATEAAVTMRYAVGAIDDPPGREGMAHLVEHLMFQQVVGGESLFATLERQATSFNGFTELEATTFTARAAPANLERFLAIEAARMRLHCETIDDSAFAREREVVRNELRQKAHPLAVLAAVHAGLFQAGHAYRRSDSVESVAAITREQACAFADQHYVTENAVLVVSGNLTTADVERAARSAFAAIARRPRPARPELAAVTRQTVTLPAPLDTPVVLYGWPLPKDHVERAKVRALGGILADHIDREVKGGVLLREFGGDRAPSLVLVAVPAKDETIESVRTIVDREIGALPTSFDNQRYYDDSFDHARGVALSRLYAELEDGGGRDTYIAAHVLADRDPAQAITAELRALAALDRGATSRLARAALRRDTASIVTLQPEAKRTGRPVELDVRLHDKGLRRVLDDPGEAERPSAYIVPRPPAIAARTLASGMRVMLLPLANAATVDIRVVIDAGTGDEPGYAHGVAMLAASALTPEPIDLADFIKFYEAGGTLDRRVELDHTVFAVRGLARDFDFLLTALERLLRNGTYESAPKLVERLRVAASVRDPDVAIDAAWRAALHGPDHTYTTAGLVRHMSFDALDKKAAAAFRARHYRPEAMTLIVAGGIEPKLADAWIDHAFATWTASADRAPSRYASQAQLLPAALAVSEDTTQVRLAIALPAVGSREQLLVAAELLDQTIADVRHQLGAAYTLSATLSESRLATRIEIGGFVDAARAADALALVRDRIAALRTPDKDTASRFVAARRRVVGQLTSRHASSAALATLVEREVAAERKPDTDATLAARIQSLTLRDLTPTLQSLDLGKAAMVMRGPDAAVQRAYKTIGRTPQVIDAK